MLVTPKLMFGYLMVATVITTPAALYAGFFDSWIGVAWSELPVFGKVVGIWALFSFFALWFWMLADFFQGRPLKYRVVIGFMLLFLNWLAATLYFIFVYAPEQKSKRLVTID